MGKTDTCYAGDYYWPDSADVETMLGVGPIEAQAIFELDVEPNMDAILDSQHDATNRKDLLLMALEGLREVLRDEGYEVLI